MTKVLIMPGVGLGCVAICTASACMLHACMPACMHAWRAGHVCMLHSACMRHACMLHSACIPHPVCMPARLHACMHTCYLLPAACCLLCSACKYARASPQCFVRCTSLHYFNLSSLQCIFSKTERNAGACSHNPQLSPNQSLTKAPSSAPAHV